MDDIVDGALFPEDSTGGSFGFQHPDLPTALPRLGAGREVSPFDIITTRTIGRNTKRGGDVRRDDTTAGSLSLGKAGGFPGGIKRAARPIL
jgi:hypothetical protein